MIATEEMSTGDGKRKLPAGWRWVRLGDVCKLNPPRPHGLCLSDDAPTTFVPMSAVDESSGTIVRPQVRPFAEVRNGYTYFAEGDVLFAKITPCMQNGKHAIARNLVGGTGFGTTEFHVVRPGDSVTPEWIHCYLRQPAILRAATAYFTGAVGQQRVPASYLKDLEIPLPGIAEQKRIAAILNDHMAAMERARAAAETQLKAAKALPAAYLRVVFNSPEAQKWERKPLRDICQGDGQYGTSEKANVTRDGLLVLRMINLFEGRIRWDDLKYIRLPKTEENKYRLIKGDVLFNRTNSAELVGKTAVFDGFREAVFASYLIRFRLLPGIADPDFVSAYINSERGRKFIAQNMARAIGQVNISASTMHRMPIPTPSIPEQERIVSILGEQIATAERTGKALAQQLDTINKLPAALLRRAFNGEL